ncbi:MAG: hypothetical protein GTO30_06820, partial [Acidobacteria bacterium]|nr:hypothetical protein [Acidobacteriota bacterium]NIQ86866.1 hypothetical protein [Acidobacteriota bacterium]
IASIAQSGSGTPRWITHLTGTVRRLGAELAETPAPPTLAALRARCPDPVDVEAFYADLRNDGLRLRDVFKTLR